MKHIGLARLGRDADLNTSGSTPRANLSLAVDYRDGQNKETQWISATLWGKAAEALAPYLLKGTVHCFTLTDMHVTLKDGKAYLNARCDSVDLGPKGQGGAAAAAPRPAPATAPAPKSSTGFDDMDDDIPF